jgi:hypothetical protein
VMLRRHAQRDAEEMAAALNAELGGGGWEPYVWENLGWHYRARRTNGLDWPDPEARCVTVYPSTYSDKTTYWALVSNDAGPGMRVVVPGTPPALVAERLPNEPTPPRDCQ